MVTTREFLWTVYPRSQGESDFAWRKARDILTFTQTQDDRLKAFTLGLPSMCEGEFNLSMIVEGRDRHWAGQLAQNVVADIVVKTRSKAKVRSAKLPPHETRGYAGGRIKTVSPRRPR